MILQTIDRYFQMHHDLGADILSHFHINLRDPAKFLNQALRCHHDLSVFDRIFQRDSFDLLGCIEQHDHIQNIAFCYLYFFSIKNLFYDLKIVLLLLPSDTACTPSYMKSVKSPV